MIIGLNGYAKSGKDEVAKAITSLHPMWEIKKFAGKLKDIASILTGVPAESFEDQSFKMKHLMGWDMTVRDFLQKLGTEGVREAVHPDAWVNALFTDYYHHAKWVITDVRFPNEAQAIKDRGGVVIRVNRPGVGPVNNHPSETALDDWDFDHVIDNSGTLQELKIKSISLL
jgi:hypothetical protein